jgi:hypothetical protein
MAALSMRAPRQPEAFPLRGAKGLWWEPEEYLDWPELLAEAGYNFLMLCYSFCPETGLSWRRPIPERERETIRRLARDCELRGIELCLALHPSIGGQAWAPERAALSFHPTAGRAWFQQYWQTRRPGEQLVADPPLRYGARGDLDILIEKFRLARDWGVRAFALCLDDIEPGVLPAGFSSLAGAQSWLLRELRSSLDADDDVRLLFVPTFYWTAGARANASYTAELAQKVPPDVDLFWTGVEIRSHAITAAQAREAAELFGRKPILWYNYASNDSFRFALQIPPDRPPSADLGAEVGGLMANLMRQSHLTRLHALVLAEYLRDPSEYRHEEAVTRSIIRLVGERAAPLLERYLEAWTAYPDSRTLLADLDAGGPPFLDRLVDALGASVAAIRAVLPGLSSALGDRQLYAELVNGERRLSLLAESLVLRRAAQAGESAAVEVKRATLHAGLARVEEETACDAHAILGST